MTQDSPLLSRPLRVADLPGVAGRPLAIDATAEERAAIAAAFDLADLASLRFTGVVTAADDGLWRLKGEVSAKAVQTCVVTLKPIKATIAERLDRLYAEIPLAGEDEVDIDPEADDPPDPLGVELDYGAAALESFALALDPYPRAKGASFAALSAAPPGVEALTDADARPFARLAALKRAMEGGEGG